MTAPVKPLSGRLADLPDREPASLIDDPSGPFVGSPEGWWTEYGGALDTRSGVVHFPPPVEPRPCPFPCVLCQRRGAE